MTTTQTVPSTNDVDHGVLNQLVGYNLRRGYFRAKQLFAERFANLELTAIQFAIIQIVGTNDLLSQKAIAQHIRTSPPAIVGPLRDLEQKGIVQRTRSESDRRNHLIRLTPAGHTLQQTLAIDIFDVEAQLLSALNDDERHQLLTLLLKVVESQP